MSPAPLRPRIAALGGTALASAAAFGAVAVASATRATAHADRHVRKKVALPKRHPARRLAAAVAPVGKWWSYMPIAVAMGTVLLVSSGRRRDRHLRRAHARRRGRGAPAAATVVAAGALATLLAPWFDRALPQPPAPPGRRSRRKPVFPSGHASGPTAVAVTSAYLLSRERVLSPAIAVPAAALLPVVTVAEKLAGQKHWASDVLGGWLAGAAVATGCLAMYELARED